MKLLTVFEVLSVFQFVATLPITSIPTEYPGVTTKKIPSINRPTKSQTIKKLPLYDLVCKKFFSENKELLVDFINAALTDGKILHFQQVNPNFELTETDKSVQSPIFLDCVGVSEDQATFYDIEVQRAGENYYEKRSLYYWSGLHFNQLSRTKRIEEVYRGKKVKPPKYLLVNRTVAINIMNFTKIQHKQCPNFRHEKITIYTDGCAAIDDLRIVDIEIPKFLNRFKTMREVVKGVSSPLEAWIVFLRYGTDIDPDTLKCLVDKHPPMEHAVEKLKLLQLTPDEQLDMQRRVDEQDTLIWELHEAKRREAEIDAELKRVKAEKDAEIKQLKEILKQHRIPIPEK